MASTSALVIEDPSPETVVIVSFGDHTESGKHFKKAIDGQGFAIIDVRSWLVRDPTSAVLHGENGQYTSTQRVVLQQEGLADLMKELIDTAWTTGKIAVFCTQGLHRSDVVGRLLEDVLNGILDVRGHRLFNAKYFALGSAPHRMHLQIIEDARTWYGQPWAVMPQSPPNLVHRYGYDAAMQTKLAWSNWQAVHDYANEQYKAFDSRAHLHDGGVPAAPVALAPEAPAAPPPWTTPSRSPMGAAAAAAPSRYLDASDAAEVMFQPATKRMRSPDKAPAWATMSRDATVWLGVLEEMQCDKTAIQSLFLLGQHSDDGYRSANAIIGKLLKKQAEGHPVRNVSAFVHACALNARNVIPKGWGSKASGSEQA